MLGGLVGEGLGGWGAAGLLSFAEVEVLVVLLALLVAGGGGFLLLVVVGDEELGLGVGESSQTPEDVGDAFGEGELDGGLGVEGRSRWWVRFVHLGAGGI